MITYKLFMLLKMTVSSYLVEISIIILILVGKYFWKKRNLYMLSQKLPGPTPLPLFGNAFVFWCKEEDFFETATDLVARFPSPMKLWLGPKFNIVFSDPKQAERILSSMAFANKGPIYKVLQAFNGDGLISGSGPKWKKDRRLMSPLFLVRKTAKYFSIILNHSKILVEKLEAKANGSDFNVELYIHRAVNDFVNETVIGTKTNAQDGELDDFLQHCNRAYDIVHRRIVKPWLQNDYIYRVSSTYREQEETKKFIHGFFWKVLDNAKKNHTHLGHNDDLPRTILDQMLDIRDEVPDFASDLEIVHHLGTLYSASEDTVTIICSFALVMLGMHQDCQSKAINEIFSVVGKARDVQEKDLSKLEYLEMVIKETLRLFPIAAFIMRESSQDFEIDNYQIPKDTSVIVSIFNIHRNPEHWEFPNKFYPEHFLPEAVSKRHPYSYLPFSAGVRGCLGKPYAYMAIKIVLVSILQTYFVEADGKLEDKGLTSDISVRFKDKKYPIRIKKRE